MQINVFGKTEKNMAFPQAAGWRVKIAVGLTQGGREQGLTQGSFGKAVGSIQKAKMELEIYSGIP